MGVLADYLLGSEKDDVIKDTTLLKFFKEVGSMPDELKNTLLKIIEAYVQNYRTKQTFS
jgi:hypothetical protein